MGHTANKAARRVVALVQRPSHRVAGNSAMASVRVAASCGLGRLCKGPRAALTLQCRTGLNLRLKDQARGQGRSAGEH